MMYGGPERPTNGSSRNTNKKKNVEKAQRHNRLLSLYLTYLNLSVAKLALITLRQRLNSFQTKKTLQTRVM